MKRSELIFNFLLIPVDILMIILSFIIAYYIRKYQGEVIFLWPIQEYGKFILLMVPFWIIIFALEGLYNPKKFKYGIDEFASIVISVSAGIMLVVAWIFLSRTLFFSRLVIIYSWVLGIFLVTFGRRIMRSLQQYLYRYNIGVHRLILIGNNSISYNLLKSIKTNQTLGYRLVGIITSPDDKDYNRKENIKILGSISDLEKIIKNHPIDDLILTDSNLADNRVLKIIEFCNEHQISFKQVPNMFDVSTSNVKTTALEGIPIIEFYRTPLQGWGKIAKRFFDIIFSFITLIILSPVFLMVAILIKCDSKGPVFFRQDRVGANGNFKIFKFRTMYDGAEKKHAEYIKKYGNMFKLKNDPRTTKVGRVLRKLSIDELPQFINVFIGNMSVVGPRPPMPIEVKLYTAQERRRLGVKPGITGMWQVSGRSDVSFEEWVKLDVYYIENWTFWLDIKIILRTVRIVITGRGAY